MPHRTPHAQPRLPRRSRIPFVLIALLAAVTVGAVVGASLHRPRGTKASPSNPAPTPLPSPSSVLSASPTATTRVLVKPTPAPIPGRRSRHPRSHPPRPSPPCPNDALRGVYHPYRLTVLKPCRTVRGIVSSVRHELDGDYHVDVVPDHRFRRLLTGGNFTAQNGALVTEIMPGQRLPIPGEGERVAVFGTWVYDTAHGWNEIHPIWAIAYLDRGVRLFRLPPLTPEYESEGPAGGPARTGSGRACTPGYSPCLPPTSDYDCAGGSGNGPKYVAGPVRVTGSDPYHLDGDGDGIGCD